LEEVFLTQYQTLMNIGLGIIADREFVKDVIQLFFLEIWEKDILTKDIQNLKAYLVRSFYRKMFQQLKKQQKFSTESLEKIDELDQEAYEAFMREQKSIEEIQQQLKIAIERLPEKEKEIFHMKYTEGLAYEEIAQFTGKSKQTVYNQLHNSIRKLRSALAGYTVHLKKK